MLQNTFDLNLKSLLRKAFLLLLSFVLAAGTIVVPFSSGASEAHAAQDGTIVVAIDPGHGGIDPGAIGVNGVKEADANWRIAQACIAELNTYSGVTAVLTQDNTVCLTRKERVENALNQGADLIVSMHCNAAEGAPSANGAEVWIPNSSPYMYNETHVPSAALGNIILKHLEDLDLYNRGLKTRSSEEGTLYPAPGGLIDYLGINYYPRFSGVPGIIIEHAFVSNASDAAKLASPEWCKKMGVADATAIAEFYGLSKIPVNGSAVAAADVQKLGEPVVTKPDYETDFSIMGDTLLSHSTDPATKKSESVAAMASWFKSKNATYPSNVEVTRNGLTYQLYKDNGAATIEDFCSILYDEAVAENIRPELVFAQIMKETGWLKFGGTVQNYQCNFCGLGAAGDSSEIADFGIIAKDASVEGESAGEGTTSGATVVAGTDAVAAGGTEGGTDGAGDGSSAEEGAVTFAVNPDGVRMGLRAQVQHLKAYADAKATAETLANPCVDPRFDQVTPKGKATTVTALSGTWAQDENYGTALVGMINELLGYEDTDGIAVSLAGLAEDAVAGSTIGVYVDGKLVEMTVGSDGSIGRIPFRDEAPRSIVMHEYNTSDTSDMHKVYPTTMHTWLVTEDNGTFTTQRYYGLENLLAYSGCSIRITGNKGIRMITGMSVTVKDALTAGGINGHTLVETGTLLAWSSTVGSEGLTFDTAGAKRGTAYVAGTKNPVLSTGNGMQYYTNVLVGDFTPAHCKTDLAMRPYAILEDANGEQFVIYGGTIHRSIGYIAELNANAFVKGSAAYNYVHSIIDACKE